ncbi:MAG: methylmalonyl-CoA mutase family protein [Polyangiales bacterium]
MSNTPESLLSGFAEVSFASWKAEVERALPGGTLETKLTTHTLEGIDVKPLYTAEDWPWAQDAAGFPAAPPHRRGGQALGRFGARWDLRPSYDNPSVAALARELTDDVDRGARSVWLRFDAETRTGRVPVDPKAGAHERGAPCLSASQLGRLLEGVPLERVTLSLDAGANALAIAACLVAAARGRKLDAERLDCWLNFDPLGALARDGSLPRSWQDARAELAALALWANAHARRWRSVTVSTVPYHDAGASAAQEIGYALATAVSYLRWLTEAGLSVADASSQLAFSVVVGSDFFMEIAKLRALRQCWSSVVAACGGDGDAQRCTLHVTTSTRTKTVRDPFVNILRETTEAFAAAVGGADAITTAGFDRLRGPSDALGRRVARNLQVILDEEAHVSRVADAAGGAWYVEALTSQLAELGWQELQTIERDGGMAASLTSGRIAARLTETARARAELIARRKQVITGVSEFADVREQTLARPEPDRQAIAAERERALQAASSDQALAAATTTVRSSSGPGRLAALADLAAAGATLAQLDRALRGSSEPERIDPLPSLRNAEPYERLRDACDARADATGSRPSVFLCNLGPIPSHKARAQFATSFFNAGGLAVLDNEGFDTVEAAALAHARSGAELAVLCGSDEAYPQWAERLVQTLRSQGAKRVVLAGRPGKDETGYRAAGISDFIYLGCNAIETLSALLEAIGVQS